MIDTYFFKLQYYSENEKNEDEIIDAYGTIGAESYSEAVGRIEKRFPTLENLSIEKAFIYDGFTFLEENEYNEKIKESKEF